MHRPLVIAFALLSSPLAGRADEPAKTPPPPKWYDTFEIHGLIDTYYSANLSQAQSAPNELRVFDAANGFQLSYLKLTAQLAPTAAYTAGFRADVGLGQTAAILNSSASYGIGAAAALSPSGGIGSVAVQQAFLSLKLPAEIVIDGGKFVTNTGAEVIEAKDDWIYSRSLLFGFAIPFTHTGLRAAIPIPGADRFSITASLFSGWDNPPRPVDSHKMGHLAVIYSGPSNTSLILNAMYGRNPFDPENRLLLDAVAGRSFGDLSVNVNVDYGKVGEAKYWGLAAMARYSLAGDKLRLSARGEILSDEDGLAVFGPGALGAGNKYFEGTLSASVPIGGNAELRLEGRRDFTDQVVLATGKSGQTTLQVAGLVWF